LSPERTSAKATSRRAALSSFYETLGVWRDASGDEIEQRYRLLCERFADEQQLDPVELAARRATVEEAFDHQIAARLDGQHQDEPLPHTIRYAVGDNRIDITLDDGATSSLWWATNNEWLGLLDVAGLGLEALFGGLNREPFDDDSREFVFVARR
jgi:hypothetical protein